ncbi:hybrid sensor histidine kinase/response regulator transcription factor [Carboxylicivirga sp. N1Y90]|uniref:hybrid sensor histidine kinase/response regulator transcription factor n=1 Tax=Carboxylicivirga fragile TaxID=3417571 RepID=UPI003D33D5CE|nr:response regulator [Marinilabiliaceae bacterium N1Y90]
MKLRFFTYIFSFLVLSNFTSKGQDIFRFEHYDSKDGLLQNSVASLLCDKDGFLWIGTLNGLNRFDGYRFKTFDSVLKSSTFINNRVINLWQDQQGYIWIETYDHYYHFFNPITESFKTVPDYHDPNYEKINKATCFLQYDSNQIWIGTNERGIYHLNHNPSDNTYISSQISDKGRFSITNNDVRFIFSSQDSAVWVGTVRGINLLQHSDVKKQHFDFEHYFINYSFNSAIELDNEVWLGTDNQGLVCFNKKSHSYHFINQSNNQLLPSNQISKIYSSSDTTCLVAFKDGGLLMYNSANQQWSKVKTHGLNIETVYFDRFNDAWITTDVFGVTKLNLANKKTNYYQLTEPEQISITDRERHVFYEDKDSNLWIGLHGGALAFYHRPSDSFKKYENEPNDNYSISSNIVHSITEDLSGQLWLGTGQYKGGLEKVIKRNPAFKHILPTRIIKQMIDNVVRCVYQDKNGYIWLSTKDGVIHIYDSNFQKIHTLQSLLNNKSSLKTTNVYCMFVDDQNHMWLGTKGHGLFVSKMPIGSNKKTLKDLTFYNYQTNTADSSSISNNNIYSIEQDKLGNIWIGTYGNGACRVTDKNPKHLTFEHFTNENSHLSSNQVRKIKCDSDSNLWFATAFGLNVIKKDSLTNKRYTFSSYFKESGNSQKINYNDVGEVFEDSEHRLWFGTFGGGVTQLQLPLTEHNQFKNITKKSGLSNNVIYGILEDDQNQLWFSSEFGLNHYNPETETIEIYNESNGLSFNNFTESACFKLNDGRLVFGGSEGVEIIDAQIIGSPINLNLIKLTNFQLFNKDVAVNTTDSPLKQSISFTDAIRLNYLQSSFSLEFSALDLLNPSMIQYAYLLEGFESNWNYVGNQTKATYTNLPHGQYTFKVKHTNRSGRWNNYTKEISITITPPWWKTTWAYLGYVLLLFGILWFTRGIIIRVNKYRQDLKLEKKISDLKLRFFTNISHEIRTPLTLILGPLEDILEDSTITKDLQNQLGLMKKNTKRMLHLVNQLLDFRRIQNNKMSLNVQKINLVSFTQSIYESFIPLAKHNGIHFKFQKTRDCIDVWADASKLDSIIYNIISNAIKFTPKGKNVSVSVEVDTDNPDTALVNIVDEGPGISHENIADIFTRFVILNKNDHRSSGIGLALAFELAKLHGGDIKVNSQLDQGSCFCFNMPIDNKHLLNQTNVMHIQKIELPPLPHKQFNEEFNFTMPESDLLDEQKNTILVVEDNKQIADYIQSKLKIEFNCLWAANGKEGLKLAEIHNPDAIVTDIMMPEMDGIEMTQKLKDNFSLCHIPIVMITAKTDMKDQIIGYESGAEAYITKPLKSQHLRAVLHSFIGQRKLVISKYRDNKTIDPDTLKVNTKDEEFLHNLLKYVEANYTEDLTVDSVAKKFCVSRTVLYNKVKGLTGLSPLEFIRQVKLKLSLELLKKGYSVTETAYKIGYTDVKYFSKQFKMLNGYPPSKVKKDLNK